MKRYHYSPRGVGGEVVPRSNQVVDDRCPHGARDGNIRMLLPLPASSWGSDPNEHRRRFRFIRSNCLRCNIAPSQAWKKRDLPDCQVPGRVLVAGDGFEPPTFAL